MFLSAVHYSDPQLTFDEDEMLFSADSIGGWRASAEQRFPFRRDGDHITIDVDTFEAPPSVLIPCGALPSELSIAPGGERLLENVAFCQPCSHEAAIDGIVGITWVRTP